MLDGVHHTLVWLIASRLSQLTIRSVIRPNGVTGIANWQSNCDHLNGSASALFSITAAQHHPRFWGNSRHGG
jgi:hypothetical protein